MRNYLIITVCAMVVGAYVMGMRIAHEKCKTASANNQTYEIINSVNLQRMANEKVFNTGVRDIRDILRQKYTIAE